MQYLLFEMGFWGPYFYLKLTSLFDFACCKLTWSVQDAACPDTCFASPAPCIPCPLPPPPSPALPSLALPCLSLPCPPALTLPLPTIAWNISFLKGRNDGLQLEMSWGFCKMLVGETPWWSVPRLGLRFFSLRTTFVIYDYSINRNTNRCIWTWLQQACTCVTEMIIRTFSFNHMKKKMFQRIRTVFQVPWRRV